MDKPKPNDLITATEARKILGCGPHKMKELLDDGTLETYDDPLDKRVRLVSRADVDALKRRSRRAA